MRPRESAPPHASRTLPRTRQPGVPEQRGLGVEPQQRVHQAGVGQVDFRGLDLAFFRFSNQGVSLLTSRESTSASR